MKSHHRLAIWIATAVFVACGLAYLIYWTGWGRFFETTNDAYVNGNMITITPQVSGIVVSLLADNTQLVEEGQPLVEIDRHDFQIALERAQADLAHSVRQAAQLYIQVEEYQAKRESSKADLLRASLDYIHRKALVDDGSVSREDFEHSETTLLAAFSNLRQVEKELEEAVARVENTCLPTHPIVEQAKSALKRAFLDLHRCIVRAPAKGIVTQRKAQVGQWSRTEDPLMALVPLDQIWVDANYREVELKNIRIGQPVEFFADMYGRGLKFHGKIVGLNPGTGSVFSILPPQNASGNWIKIIQRIPVKISLKPEEIEAHPLVLGLSVTTSTDTHHRGGLRLPEAMLPKAIYKTAVYACELEGVDEMIDQIIADNAPLSEKHD